MRMEARLFLNYFMALVLESLNDWWNEKTNLTRQAVKIKSQNDTNGFVVLDHIDRLILQNLTLSNEFKR